MAKTARKPEKRRPAAAAAAKTNAKAAAKTSAKAGTKAGTKNAPARPAARAAKSATSARPSAPFAADKRKTGRKHSPEPAPRPAAPASPGASEGRGKYVYCIIRASEALRFGPIGIGAEPTDVQTINWKDLAAVVSDTPVEVLDATRENVLAHERVNEAVMRKHTVIPMSFGTVFKTRDDIIELLKAAYEAFNDVLNKMEGKLEFGLKVLWDRDEMIRAIEKDDEDVRRLKDEISSQKGSTYFARMQYGRLVEAALEARSERYVHEIFEKLRPVAVALRANKPIGDRMIMNAAFLVSRENEADFDQRVKEIGGRYEKLTFKYTGPWPPYNFVNIRLKLERARETPPGAGEVGAPGRRGAEAE